MNHAAFQSAFDTGKLSGEFRRSGTRLSAPALRYPLERPETVRPAPPLPATVRTSGKVARRTLGWVAAASLAAVIVADRPWKRLHAEALSVSAPADAKRVVQIDRPAPASTANVVLPATFRPWQTTTLHARVSGYLTAWHHDLGAEVKAGDLLAEIETPELDQELAEGKALASEAAAAAVQARAERVEAQSDLQVAEAQLARVQAEVTWRAASLCGGKNSSPGRQSPQKNMTRFARKRTSAQQIWQPPNRILPAGARIWRRVPPSSLPAKRQPKAGNRMSTGCRNCRSSSELSRRSTAS